jgi:hypothetical protein
MIYSYSEKLHQEHSSYINKKKFLAKPAKNPGGFGTQSEKTLVEFKMHIKNLCGPKTCFSMFLLAFACFYCSNPLRTLRET